MTAAERRPTKPSPLQRVARLWRSLLVRGASASFRFPVAALCMAAIGFLANSIVAREDYSESQNRWLLALVAGAAASVAFTLFAEGRGARLTVARLAGAFGFLVAFLPICFVEPLWLYGPALLLAAISIVPLAPFIGRGSSREFWDFALWTWLGVALAWVSVLIFLLGCTAILEMIRYLFGIGIRAQAYGHLFATGLGFVGPLFALGRIPHPSDTTREDVATERLAQAVRPLFEWVMAPLVWATAIVIHLYAARILATGDVPSGEIGWLFVTYAALVLALRLALEPYQHKAQLPGRLFLRWWPILLVVPTALFAYALRLRIDDEGWTVARYYAALFGLGVVAAAGMQALRRMRADIRFVAALPPTFLVLSTFGPWGAGAMVERSQTGLIERQFGDALRQGEDAVRALSWNELSRLRSRMDALSEVGRTSRLEAALGAFAGSTGTERLASLERARDQGGATPRADRPVDLGFEARGAIDTSGFDRVIPGVDMYSVPDDTIDPPADTAWLRNGRMTLRYGGTSDEIDLGSVMAGRPSTTSGTAPPFSRDLRSAGGRTVRLRIEVATLGAGDTVTYLKASIALRDGEWAAR
ncbi:DUF4153 domain-containing protein [Aureimonas sp. ME7]|uniref:DUF4153 domain-containing protein n=1 Tax=Aureimonas sp. ME7 TaxID=2744252 RepID=UPI0015F524FE|nr:DUF4153 domain-containing protein [Aureimonas sp. ME7]